MKTNQFMTRHLETGFQQEPSIQRLDMKPSYGTKIIYWLDGYL